MWVKLGSFDSQYFHVANERRRMKRVADSVTRLQSQLACEVWMFRARKQAQLNKSLTNQEVAQLYAESLYEPQSDEESLANPRMIGAAILVYERVLNFEPLREVVTALDRKYGSKGPFNSLSKLSDLYNKCGSVSRMTWVLKLTWLCLKHEKLDLSDFAVKKLTSQAGGTKVGTLELMLLKHKLLQYLLNFFLDSKNFEHKDLLRACFAAPDTYEEKYLLADKTFMSSWSKSSSKLADLIENCCFAFNSQETPSLKTAVKMNKTPEELLQEYNPFKSEVEEILKCLAEERALNPVNALVYDDGEEYEEEGVVWPHDQPAPEVTSGASGPQPAGEIPEEWESYVTRYLQKHCHLIVEAKKSQTQLEQAIRDVNLGKVQGGPSGNVILLFDSNLWGEAITSPHVRRPPVAKTPVQKVWKALQAARAQDEQVGLLPAHDVLIIIDGGRTDESLLQNFGMGGSRRKFDAGRTHRDGKTVYRCINLFLEEKSVKARKYRKRSRHDFIQCTQRIHCYFSSMTKVQERMHKYMPEISNLSNTYGPVVLPAWGTLPMMTLTEKKVFWGSRRRAVGGPTPGAAAKDSDSEKADEDELEDDEEVTPEDEIQFQLPEVGTGRGHPGSKAKDNAVMPICFHTLPCTVTEAMVHGFWGISVIDMIPGTGECCSAHILQGLGYLGICQSEEQKAFILEKAQEAILRGMADPQSRAYAPAYAKSVQENKEVAKKKEMEQKKADPKAKAKVEADPKAKAKAEAKKTSKKRGADESGASGTQAKPKAPALNSALSKMLETAKLKDGSEKAE